MLLCFQKEAMDTKLRRVKVMLKRQKREVSIEVFATRDPVRAAKRFVKTLGFDIADFEWKNAEVLEGPNPDTPRELEAFEEEIFLRMLTGEIETSRTV